MARGRKWIRTAVIPAAGRGTRLLPATRAVPKALLPVVDRPAIHYAVEEAVAAGLDDLIIVTPPGTGIAEHFRWDGGIDQPDPGDIRRIVTHARLRYVPQDQPLGLGHAVALAGADVADEAFAVLLPDVIATDGGAALGELISLAAQHKESVVALERIGPEEASAHGCVAALPVRDHLVRVTDVVEKPAPSQAPSDLKLAGQYVLRREILPILAALRPGYGDEIQLSDGIAELAGTMRVLGAVSDHHRLDVGSTLGYLTASVLLALERQDLRGPLSDLLAVVAGRRVR